MRLVITILLAILINTQYFNYLASEEAKPLSKNKKISHLCLKISPLVKKESLFYDNPDLYPMFMGQIEQESRCDSKVTAFDGGQGLAQFMPKTAEWIHSKYEDLYKVYDRPNPYNPKWAVKAMILYDLMLYDQVLCQDWHFALRAYNGGLGNINKEIKKADSCDPEEVAKCCSRSKFSCEVNIKYPALIFKKAEKYLEPYYEK